MLAPDLERRRILVVEDDFLLAKGIAEEIKDHNGVVLGPVSTLQQGINALWELNPDAGILDIKLGPDTVYELADRLIERHIPFIFASSESRDTVPKRFAHIPLHTKPVSMIKTASALM